MIDVCYADEAAVRFGCSHTARSRGATYVRAEGDQCGRSMSVAASVLSDRSCLKQHFEALVDAEGGKWSLKANSMNRMIARALVNPMQTEKSPTIP